MKKKVKVDKAHRKPQEVTIRKNTLWKVGVAVLGIIVLILIFNVKSGSQETQLISRMGDAANTLSGSGSGDVNQEISMEGKVKVDFYVMSQCPYGTQVEDAFAPVIDRMGDAIDFNVDFIAAGSPGSFSSLHGNNEVEGDIAQLCGMKYSQGYEWVDMITCMNQNAGNIPSNWEDCADEAGLDVDTVKACYEGDEGQNLLADSIAKSDAIGARASPTIYIADVPYSGGRQTDDFMRAVCNEVDHPACSDIPKPVEVDLIVLNDEKCTTCDTSSIMAVNKQYFPGIKVTEVDASSDEGKNLIDMFGLTFAPAFIFSDAITETNSWKTNPSLAGFFDKIGDYYKLKDSATGASWFLDEEARQAFYRDIGVELGDNRPQVDFFVMSYCPYGNQAEELLKPVFDVLGDDVDFNPRYVIYPNYGGGGPTYCIDENDQFCSMHGIQELNQDIREECVNRIYGIGTWFDFALAMNSECTAQNADSCWEGVAGDLGIDTAAVQECFNNDALEIVSENQVLGDKLGVSGSPTVFFDGDLYAGGRTAEGYKAAICAKFTDAPAACDDVIDVEVAPAPAGGQC